MRHAYLGRTDRPIKVLAEADEDHVRVVFRHQGASFDPTSAPPPTFDGSRDGGFGIYVMENCVDKVRYHSNAADDNVIELLLYR